MRLPKCRGRTDELRHAPAAEDVLHQLAGVHHIGAHPNTLAAAQGNAIRLKLRVAASTQLCFSELWVNNSSTVLTSCSLAAVLLRHCVTVT